jgi:hypothetical protein
MPYKKKVPHTLPWLAPSPSSSAERPRSEHRAAECWPGCRVTSCLPPTRRTAGPRRAPALKTGALLPDHWYWGMQLVFVAKRINKILKWGRFDSRWYLASSQKLRCHQPMDCYVPCLAAYTTFNSNVGASYTCTAARAESRMFLSLVVRGALVPIGKGYRPLKSNRD